MHLGHIAFFLELIKIMTLLYYTLILYSTIPPPGLYHSVILIRLPFFFMLEYVATPRLATTVSWPH